MLLASKFIQTLLTLLSRGLDKFSARSKLAALPSYFAMPLVVVSFLIKYGDPLSNLIIQLDTEDYTCKRITKKMCATRSNTLLGVLLGHFRSIDFTSKQSIVPVRIKPQETAAIIITT